ncbi:MAG: transcription-repair coupling factor [Erysipelotrichaceae bacterium]
MNTLLNIIKNNPAIDSLAKHEQRLGNLSLTEEALLLAGLFQRDKQNIVVVKNNLYTAQKLFQRLQSLSKDVLLFAMEDSLRVESIAASPESKASQLETMSMLLADDKKIIVTHTGALLHYLANPNVFKEHIIHLVSGEEFGYDYLKRLLFESGYHHVARVDQPLCFATRGGIIDVYSINNNHPIRIEFFDNEIDSIRSFDISTQRTLEVLKTCNIVAASDLLFSDQELGEIVEKANTALMKTTKQESCKLSDIINKELDDLCNHNMDPSLYKYFAYLNHTFSILDYIEDPLVLISSEEEVRDSCKHIQEETIAYIQELVQESMALPKYSLFHDFDQVIEPYSVIKIGLFVNHQHPLTSGIVALNAFDLKLSKTMEYILNNKKDTKLVFALAKKEKTIVEEYLKDHEIQYQIIKEETPLDAEISILEKELVEGFSCTLEKIDVYSGKELFNTTPKLSRYANKFKEAEVLHNYMELEIGDFIVHQQHGIGKYLGIVNKEMDGVHKDFLNIAYKGNDILLVPLEHFRLIRKFLSKEGATPKLNKLGGNEWEKTKERISANIKELADRLVKLYAIREDHIGYAFSKDTPFQKEFDDDFEFELTPDQERAIKEVKADMEMNKPMDRLLCGDVGFGKTEVAMRAAFKAVIDNKQVAFLCPTTILSLQHYKTFVRRMANFPIHIEVINRFIAPAKQKQILKECKEGKIDILIGTHRLLSKDVKFADLGFLVIDEEQRFGVEHKEKIKELKHSVDVLSLSATPIPRTLQMSLIGIRSLSQLDTPPQNRMPVQTYVIEKNLSIIKEIMQRELSRNGQVFYLFNNVKEIYNVATRLRKMLPDARIGVAHGQMSREEIEDVMMKFTNNEYQILVCTTIIETGIDIPNANTILIENADRFGLSQLYQIKGRVGRSDRLAYAYLMYSPQKTLSELATKRLKSIKEFTQLGSGYKIAMRDLTIRGAGDMLGPQQAGFIDTIGIDMYIEMLNDAIKETQGIVKEPEVIMKKANTKLDAYIPQSFAPQDYEKITLYQRIDRIQSKQALFDMMEEIKDNYGRLPKGVQMLFEKKRLDLLVNEECLDDFKEGTQEVELIFTETWSDSVDGVKLFEMITTISKDIKIRYVKKQIRMKIPKTKNWLAIVIEILEQVKTFSLD